MTQRLFIYGTLKRGLSNSHYMEGQRFVAEAKTKPVYRMVDCGGYPGMFSVKDGGVSIKGEIWEVDEPGREKLDILEDVAAGLYKLETVELEPPFDDEPVLTYIYAWPVTGRPDVGAEWREQEGVSEAPRPLM